MLPAVSEGAVTQLITARTAAPWGRKWQCQAAEPCSVAAVAVWQPQPCTDTVPLPVLGTAVHCRRVLRLVDSALPPRLLAPCRQPPLHLCQPALPHTQTDTQTVFTLLGHPGYLAEAGL